LFCSKRICKTKWNTLGYLQVRDTVMVNVSYFFDFADDPSAGGSQVRRGAALLHATAAFRNSIVTGEKPADTIGRNKTPICSTAYKYMFHATRIPQPEQDCVKLYDPSLNTHAVVSRNGLFYAFDLVDPRTQQPVGVDVLERQLEEIKRMADRDAASSHYPELGWLTSSHRDEWAQARKALLDAGGEPMARALEDLQSGAILMCLDDAAPVSRAESALLYLHGGGSGSSSAGPSNRWFDKSIQLVVAENGKAGLNGEHSLMDGMVRTVTHTSVIEPVGFKLNEKIRFLNHF